MKKVFMAILAAILLAPASLTAQTVEITPFAGYVFGSSWYGNGGSVYIAGNAQYGGQVSIGISRVIDIDLIYNRSDTRAELSGFSLVYETTPISVNYFQLGFTKNFRVNPIVSPYFGMNLGAVEFFSKDGQYNDAWFFSAGINGGAKIYFSKRVGLKLQAQMYLPIQGAGFTMYFGGGGPSTGVSMYSTMVQFGFTGGLVFRLGKIYNQPMPR